MGCRNVETVADDISVGEASAITRVRAPGQWKIGDYVSTVNASDVAAADTL